MDEIRLYEKILGIGQPWEVEEIEFDEANGAVLVYVGLSEEADLCCPGCGKPTPRYDKRRRQWRHLDTCQFKTYVFGDVPRVNCPEDGIVTVSVPWADKNSRFTLLFESFVISWLKGSSISYVAKQLGMSWNAVDGIMRRAVKRGLSKRKNEDLKNISIDEIAYQKRHEYVTVVSNSEGNVLSVIDERKAESLRSYYKCLSDEQKASIETVSMDMWPAYIRATRDEIPNADDIITFDKYHVMASLNKAVDDVRKIERKQLAKEQINVLVNTKYLWLKNYSNLEYSQKRQIAELRKVVNKTARAWAIKEHAKDLWSYRSPGWAKNGWDRWYQWAIRSRLEPVKKVARMVKDHLWGIINAIVYDSTNASAESINSKIKLMKAKARGYRNRERFKTAIYFYCGGLDLYPKIPANPP